MPPVDHESWKLAHSSVMVAALYSRSAVSPACLDKLRLARTVPADPLAAVGFKMLRQVEINQPGVTERSNVSWARLFDRLSENGCAQCALEHIPVSGSWQGDSDISTAQRHVTIPEIIQSH